MSYRHPTIYIGSILLLCCFMACKSLPSVGKMWLGKSNMAHGVRNEKANSVLDSNSVMKQVPQKKTENMRGWERTAFNLHSVDPTKRFCTVASNHGLSHWNSAYGLMQHFRCSNWIITDSNLLTWYLEWLRIGLHVFAHYLIYQCGATNLVKFQLMALIWLIKLRKKYTEYLEHNFNIPSLTSIMNYILFISPVISCDFRVSTKIGWLEEKKNIMLFSIPLYQLTHR